MISLFFHSCLNLLKCTDPFEGFISCRSSKIWYEKPTCSIVVIWVKILQNELMVEIYFKSLVRAIGKVLLVKFS